MDKKSLVPNPAPIGPAYHCLKPANSSPDSTSGSPFVAEPLDLNEHSLSSQLVYQGVFLRIRKDEALLPDGSVGVREFVVHPGAAAMVPLLDDGRILMERQFRYPLGKAFLEIPAGKIDAGETPLQTAQRELVEETGFKAAHWAKLTVIHPAIGFANEVIHIYLCKGLQAVPRQLDEGEFIECVPFTLDELNEKIRTGELTDVKTQIAVHWLERLQRGDWPWPEFTVIE
jgi:ADP-ribose pyrophosphatase